MKQMKKVKMKMVNKIILVGKVDNQLPSPDDEFRFVLMTKKTTVDKDYIERHTIITKGKWSEYSMTNLKRGQNISIEGRIEYRSEQVEGSGESRINCLIHPYVIEKV